MNRGKYFSTRDRKLFTSIINELYDDVTEVVVSLFKLSAETETNIYGEVSERTGKVYFSPLEVSCGIDISEISTEDGDFGVDRNQQHSFKFFEPEMRRINFYPEHGDLILYNDKYFEITNIVRDQVLGGQPDKSHSIICQAVYVSLSNVQIIPRA